MNSLINLLYWAPRRVARRILPTVVLDAITFFLDWGVYARRAFFSSDRRRDDNQTNAVALKVEEMLQNREPIMYLLGSGPSIQELDTAAFEQMRRGVTIGVNNWIHHEFVPDLFYYEGTDDPYERQLIESKIVDRYEKYRDVAFCVPTSAYIRRNGEPAFNRLKQAFGKSLYPLNVVAPQWRTSRFARSAVKRMGSWPFRGGLLHCRSSMSVALNLALRAPSVREIVLVGVDLYSHEYFWESDDDHLPEVERRQGEQHSTLVTDTTKISIVDYILASRQTYALPRDIKMSLGSKHSVLAEHLPLWKWS